MRREAETQSPLHRPQQALEFNARQIDFQSVTPREPCWFVAQLPVPTQGRLQGESSSLDERSYMICGKWLFCDTGCQKSEQHPTQEGSDGSREEAFYSCEE
jgi:hypothetical protein